MFAGERDSDGRNPTLKGGAQKAWCIEMIEVGAAESESRQSVNNPP